MGFGNVARGRHARVHVHWGYCGYYTAKLLHYYGPQIKITCPGYICLRVNLDFSTRIGACIPRRDKKEGASWAAGRLCQLI